MSRVGVRIAEGTPQSRGVLTDSLAFPHVRTKIEKEKKEHAKLHGMIRTEISGAEIAEEMEKERRYFQLQMCEVGVRGGQAGLTRGLGAAPRCRGCCCPLSASQAALGGSPNAQGKPSQHIHLPLGGRTAPGKARSGRRFLGTNGATLWLWSCLPKPGAPGP